MRIKSYFAASVQAAMEQARRELGPDALLVDSRKAPPEGQALGEYEVVFALAAEGSGTASALPAGKDASAGFGDASSEQPMMREIARLRQQVQEVLGAFILRQPDSWGARPPEFAAAFSMLVERGFSAGIAAKIVTGAHLRLEEGLTARPLKKARFDSAEVSAAVREELEHVVAVDASLGPKEGNACAAALVGPPGSGKTSTLVKLAVRYGNACSRPVHLVSTDTCRVGAVDQLRTYANIIGAGFDAAETPSALEQIVAAHRERALVLIDTPGYAPAEMQEAAEWAFFFKRASGFVCHLVLPAYMQPAGLSSVIDRFDGFAPSRLIFTKLDEASSCGAIASVSVQTGKPVSFLGTGQQIPEDLEPASVSRILDLALESAQQAARSAA